MPPGRGTTLTAGGDPRPPLQSILDAGLAELGLDVPAAARARLIDLVVLLERWGHHHNLTGFREAEPILRRLVLDAVALSTVLPPAASVADLGSGPGLPGLPLAILRPETGFLLVEARERRHHFQRSAVRGLALENVRLRRGRVGEIEPEPAELAIAQAMGPPATVLGWLLEWAIPGGWIALPASTATPAPATPDGCDRLEPRAYRVPLGGPERRVWLGRSSPAA